MATQATVAESKRDCQCRGVVTSRILQEVQSFIKFPMAEVLTCPEEKLAKVSTRDLGGDFPVS